MPSATGNKRVRGVSVYRPFVFGSRAHPYTPKDRPADCPPDHTHGWTIFVEGVNGEDISYWLKKVQFKLHETYANNVRVVEKPPFQISETGWGEFEIQIKLYFVPESNEKPQTLWHSLKLHPYGPDAEGMKERGDDVISQNYEEIIFNEPIEPFYEILTGGPAGSQPAKSKSKNTKQIAPGRTAEIPINDTPATPGNPGNPYSQDTEGKELDRMAEATRTVEQMIKEEKERLIEREKYLAQLRESEGVPANTKKR